MKLSLFQKPQKLPTTPDNIIKQKMLIFSAYFIRFCNYIVKKIKGVK